MAAITITGRLVTGLGEAIGFTQIPWARDQFVAKLGIDPYPGTVNLVLDEAAERAKWQAVKRAPGIAIVPPRPAWCDARCWRVRLAGAIAGAIVLPDLESYPPAQVEIIAAVCVRDALGLADGDAVTVEVGG